MAGAFLSRRHCFTYGSLRPFYYAARLLCAEKEGISCIGLYLNLSVELYEMEPERNYAMVLARHRIDLLAISVT